MLEVRLSGRAHLVMERGIIIVNMERAGGVVGYAWVVSGLG